ncbi:hypothetical protein GORHZ_119_00480 [Gordonia rhizosphera NBRC 16068]|uniref:Transposase n=1 Tax=Gordonia rhizosphera NBRC 16068 TaxID=1108045 RepID=K6VVK6_9ACTN|nr:hypothetical protein GORHZ_119_00480 [Gordonia rhizosphera NBRC 16068]
MSIFPNPAAFPRLATAVVIEPHDEWQVCRCRTHLRQQKVPLHRSELVRVRYLADETYFDVIDIFRGPHCNSDRISVERFKHCQYRRHLVGLRGVRQHAIQPVERGRDVATSLT